MCRIYNNIGSLTYIKAYLQNHDIYDFSSLNEVQEFQKSLVFHRQKIISKFENIILAEKDSILIELQSLEEQIAKNDSYFDKINQTEIDELFQEIHSLNESELPSILKQITSKFRIAKNKFKIFYLDKTAQIRKRYKLKTLIKSHENIKSQFDYYTIHFEVAVLEKGKLELEEYEKKKSIVAELQSFIAGAIGESRVVKELDYLSNDYILINDFSLNFKPPIYHLKENDYIKSIQIDHILVGPSGVFIIETKNWSEQFIENSYFRSPIQQIKRTSYVLYRLLHYLSDNKGFLKKHGWGSRKVPLRNLIVFTNSKPQVQFDFVKMLSVFELNNYINYFKPVFTHLEVNSIAEYLLSLNNTKTLRFGE